MSEAKPGLSDNEIKTLAAEISLHAEPPLGTPAQVLAIARQRAKMNKSSIEVELQTLNERYAKKAEQKPVVAEPATPAAPTAPSPDLGKMSEQEIDDIIEPDTALANLPDERPSTSAITIPANLVGDARQMRQLLDEVKRSVLTKRDISIIQGKPWINRSGWMLISGAFHVSDEVVSQNRTVDDKGVVTWTFVVRATVPGIRSVIGVGMARTIEGKDRNGNPLAKEEHAAYATAHTRAKCRAISDIVGAGIASAAEIGE